MYGKKINFTTIKPKKDYLNTIFMTMTNKIENINPNTLFIGKKIVYLPNCHSTNDSALSILGSNDVFEGTTIITSRQTSGKGQKGNRWQSEPGKNLTFSIILKPGFLDVKQQFKLNFAVSLGIFDFLSSFFKSHVKIKWPNDIYYKDSKIAGILIENSIRSMKMQHSIVGVGLNVNQEEALSPELVKRGIGKTEGREKAETKKRGRQFTDSPIHRFTDSVRKGGWSTDRRVGNAVSMKMICGKEYSLENMLADLLGFFEVRYLQLKANKHQILKSDYMKCLYWYEEKHLFRIPPACRSFSAGRDSACPACPPELLGGDKVGRFRFSGYKFEKNQIVEGKIVGIDESGKLGIKIGKEVIYFGFKEIEFVK